MTRFIEQLCLGLLIAAAIFAALTSVLLLCLASWGMANG